ncbi:hypothetical protein GA0074692_2052 [Micromonospora pallida]|uniref:Neutral/alkaline non-lysosomal ceramidase, N-terminal n=1 Tax=Micromonospora pallida TaxID=145854 RepID=A0A1C6S938_9ACTN|nr:hypothetical protein [Micromonospora pallida]SCL25926.1 hypothetical protein GA0074692_2052 [Micromonospora pallida]
MRVGHGTAHLAVVPGEPMGGYVDRSEGVQDVLDPLEVHVVTVADDDHRFALVVVDLICVNADIVERIRAAVRGVGVSSCWVAATHTHASPEAGCAPGGGATPQHLGDRLVAASLAAARRAVATERPARLAATRSLVSGLAGRRNVVDSPPMDIPVDTIAVTVGTDVVGLIVVSPVHPTILPAANNHVSADLTGGIRRALSAPDRWVVVATGAAGDISTRHTRQGHGPPEVGRLGALVADRFVPPPSPVEDRPAAPVRPPVSRCVRLRPKQPAELDASARPIPEVRDGRIRQVLHQGLRIAREQAARQRSEPYEVEVAAVDLDGVTLVGVPGELFLELGEAIRATAGDVVVLGYTNGYLGYLPARDTPPCYETFASPVSAGSGEIVVETAVEVALEAARDRDRSRRNSV